MAPEFPGCRSREQVARDQHALDLGGALADSVVPHIAVEPRDRLSPPHAIACAAARGEPIAPLPAGGRRDWAYAPFVGAALAWLLTAPRLAHRLYNVGAGATWHPRDLARALGVPEAGGGREVELHDDPSRTRTFLDVRRLAGEFRAPPSPQEATDAYAHWVKAHPEWCRA
jgi:nucleoside-diphosphate-sugar epimerase